MTCACMGCVGANPGNGFHCPCGANCKCRCTLSQQYGPYRPFDMHAPFDAPLRMRERQRELDLERWEEFRNSPEGKAMLEKAIKEAMEQVREKATPDSGSEK